jgi:beta-glucosidase
VLFGDVNPGGKLPFTIPTSAGSCPVYYSKLSQGKVKGYAFETPGELLPFGFGLSYTTFDFAEARLEASEVPVGKRVRVEVDVTNTGKVAGDEVVQLYVKDLVASVARPARLLRAFERITLEPGQTKTARFELGDEAFRFTDVNLDEVVEPGAFEIGLGPNSRDLKTVELTLT